jgi:site-specific DNA-methyltransferase (adenine-specific)
MTPYYADDLVTIYHGDCREWSGKADAVLTDPPYGRDAVRLWDALATVAGDSLAPGGWLVAYSGQSCLPEVMAALDSRLVYRWALAAVYPGGEQMARIGDMTVLTGWKPVLAYRKPPFGSERGVHGRFTAGGRTGISDVLRRGGREKDAHEWAQPLGEASELIERFTRPPATILDPFAGSGTFLMAAKSLGRHAIGIEIEERYCEIAARRCSLTPDAELGPRRRAFALEGLAPMTYFKSTTASNWYTGGENASVECLNRDECDFEVAFFTTREATRLAEEHVLATGHSVQIERAQFRVINPVKEKVS